MTDEELPRMWEILAKFREDPAELLSAVRIVNVVNPPQAIRDTIMYQVDAWDRENIPEEGRILICSPSGEIAFLSNPSGKAFGVSCYGAPISWLISGVRVYGPNKKKKS